MDRAKTHLCCRLGLTSELFFQLVEDHALGFGHLSGLGQFLDDLCLFSGEDDASPCQRRKFGRRIAQCLAQLHRCGSQVHLQSRRQIEGEGLGALEVLSRYIGEREQPRRRVIEDLLVAEDRLAL